MKLKKRYRNQVRFNDTAGTMAKDSVFNAASVIRKITDKDIKDYDVHVNIVGGGNIDGPSAGAAITVCIISALLEKPIKTRYCSNRRDIFKRKYKTSRRNI